MSLRRKQVNNSSAKERTCYGSVRVNSKLSMRECCCTLCCILYLVLVSVSSQACGMAFSYAVRSFKSLGNMRMHIGLALACSVMGLVMDVEAGEQGMCVRYRVGSKRGEGVSRC